ncbi:MAG: DUF6159 family protein [Acidobacteriaceae bacterium]
MGRILRSWDLLEQSFGVLMSDMEMLWLPVYAALASGAASLLLLSAGALLFSDQLITPTFAGPRLHNAAMTPGMWAALFVFYAVNFFIVVFFNVALVSVAGDRLSGGHATVNDGLALAWQRKVKIFEWALLAATVGILLRSLENSLKGLGRLTAGVFGASWSLACYFVVPVLAAENLGPVEALERSAQLFGRTWGEELTGGFSFGLIFTLLGLPAVLFVFLGWGMGPMERLGGIALAVIYLLLLSVVSSAVKGVFVAALYHYATTKQATGGLRLEELAAAWRPKSAYSGYSAL